MNTSKIEMALRRREYHKAFNKGKKYKKQRRISADSGRIDSYYTKYTQAAR